MFGSLHNCRTGPFSRPDYRRFHLGCVLLAIPTHGCRRTCYCFRCIRTRKSSDSIIAEWTSRMILALDRARSPSLSSCMLLLASDHLVMAFNRFSHVSPFKNVEAHVAKVLWLLSHSGPWVLCRAIDSDVVNAYMLS